MSCPTHLTKAQQPISENTSGQPMPVSVASSVQEAVHLLIQTGQPFRMDDVVTALKKKQSVKAVQNQLDAAVQAAVAAGSMVVTPTVTPDGRQVKLYSPRSNGDASRKPVSALGELPVPRHAVSEAKKTTLSGGKAGQQEYFQWAEYRRPKDHQGQPLKGATFEVDGKDIPMGEYIAAGPTKENVSCLRRGNPPLVRSSSRTRVGCTLPDAVRMLASGEIVETQDGLVELYDAGRTNLLAVYDPAAQTAADAEGSATISPAQTAVYLAYRALHGQDIKDAGFLTDLSAFMRGQGKMAAALDSAAMLMKETDGAVKFGGQIGTPRCADCGRFMGDGHICPVKGKDQADEPAPSASTPVDQNLDQARSTFQAAQQAAQSPAAVPPAGDALAQMTEWMAKLTQSQLALQQMMGNMYAMVREKTAVQNPVQAEPEPATPKERKPREIRPPRAPKTEQEKIYSQIVLPAPDNYLDSLPVKMGGKRYEPLLELIPTVDDTYYINDETRQIMTDVTSMILTGQKFRGNNLWSRCFALAGPPGTGKNEFVRQLAASIRTVDEDGNISQGMGVVSVDVSEHTTVEELIGGTKLVAKDGGTESVAQLGIIGEAAAAGRVIVVNEIVRNPKLCTAMHQMIEDGIIVTSAIEGEPVRVHPSTTFVFTWNPGYEGDREHPGMAIMDRIDAYRMTRPTPDELRLRLEAHFAKLPKEFLASFSDREIRSACTFWYTFQTLGMGGVNRGIGKNNDTDIVPSARKLFRFMLTARESGWGVALKKMQMYLNQDYTFDDDWKVVKETFLDCFGREYGKYLTD